MRDQDEISMSVPVDNVLGAATDRRTALERDMPSGGMQFEHVLLVEDEPTWRRVIARNIPYRGAVADRPRSSAPN